MRDAEESVVEGDSLGLATGGHRQLHMVEPDHTHRAQSASPHSFEGWTASNRHGDPVSRGLGPKPNP